MRYIRRHPDESLRKASSSATPASRDKGDGGGGAGFEIAPEAYRAFVAQTGLAESIRAMLEGACSTNGDELAERSAEVQTRMASAELPFDVEHEITLAYQGLCASVGTVGAPVTIRSLVRAGDPTSPPLHDQGMSSRDVSGSYFVLEAVREAFAKLFSPSAIAERIVRGIDHFALDVSVDVEPTARPSAAKARASLGLVAHVGQLGGEVDADARR